MPQAVTGTNKKKNKTKESTNNKNKTIKNHKFLNSFLRTTIIYLVSIGIVVGTVAFAINKVYNNFLKPVDVNDKSEVSVVIRSGSSVSQIAKTLYENELIRNTGIFKLYVDFSGNMSKLKAGNFTLTRNMGMSDIVDTLVSGGAAEAVVWVTIPEGKNVEEIAEIFATQKMENDKDKNVFSFTKQEFLDAAKDIDKYIGSFPYLYDIPEERKQSDYPLEGYLFPAKYQFFVTAKPEEIIKKILSTGFDRHIYNGNYSSNKPMALYLEEMGWRLDDIITLASIIEKESISKEVFKVSAVFHNRLEKEMPLGSCATVSYAHKLLGKAVQDELVLNSEEIAIESPYNTYKVKGLPTGPICNPGYKAVKAALEPYEEYIKEGMLYFVRKPDDTGEHNFSDSLKEHTRNKEAFDKWKKNQEE